MASLTLAPSLTFSWGPTATDVEETETLQNFTATALTVTATDALEATIAPPPLLYVEGGSTQFRQTTRLSFPITPGADPINAATDRWFTTPCQPRPRGVDPVVLGATYLAAPAGQASGRRSDVAYIPGVEDCYAAPPGDVARVRNFSAAQVLAGGTFVANITAEFPQGGPYTLCFSSGGVFNALPVPVIVDGPGGSPATVPAIPTATVPYQLQLRGYSLAGADRITVGLQSDLQGQTCPSDPTAYNISSAQENISAHYGQTGEATYTWTLETYTPGVNLVCFLHAASGTWNPIGNVTVEAQLSASSPSPSPSADFFAGVSEWFSQNTYDCVLWVYCVVVVLCCGCVVLCCVVLCCAVLCCAVLCCAVLCCAVLCCAVLCCVVLCCAVLCCAVLCCVVLCCVVLCCAVLCCAVLCCAVLCCAVLCCVVLCCAVLCCAVLCCAVLCCAVLCCAVLCCAVLCCAVLCCAVLCCVVLCCVVLCCAVLCCVVLCCAVLCCAVLCCVVLCCVVLCCVVLCCVVLCCVVLCCVVLCCVVLCCVVLCCVVLCCVVLCCVVLCCVVLYVSGRLWRRF